MKLLSNLIPTPITSLGFKNSTQKLWKIYMSNIVTKRNSNHLLLCKKKIYYKLP